MNPFLHLKDGICTINLKTGSLSIYSHDNILKLEPNAKTVAFILAQVVLGLNKEWSMVGGYFSYHHLSVVGNNWNCRDPELIWNGDLLPQEFIKLKKYFDNFIERFNNFIAFS